VGHSAGGHLALQAAADGVGDHVRGVLALAPVADLQLGEALALDGDAVRAFLGGPAVGRADLDPSRMAAPAARIHLLHGLDDAVVPLSVSESYRARHPRAALDRVGAGHFALIDPRSRVWHRLVAALGAVSS
jgi:acetyl esterase/lipase